MEYIGTFTISCVDMKVEDSESYVDNITSEQIEEFINDHMDRTPLGKRVGERCEGNIYMNEDSIKLESRSCVELGEDWDSDVWEENDDIFVTRSDRTI